MNANQLTHLDMATTAAASPHMPLAEQKQRKLQLDELNGTNEMSPGFLNDGVWFPKLLYFI
jgi:hypothetical protein